MHLRRALLGAVVAISLSGAIVGVICLMRAPENAPRPLDRGGHAITLDLHGQPVTLLHFWASWCAPCQTELVQLVAFAEARHIRLVTIAEDDRWSDTDGFLRAHGVAPETYLDPARTLAQHDDVKGLPTTLVIGSDGSVRSRFDGPVDWTSPTIMYRLGLR